MRLILKLAFMGLFMLLPILFIAKINTTHNKTFQVKCEDFYEGSATRVYVGESGTSFTDSNGNKRNYPPGVKCEVREGM